MLGIRLVRLIEAHSAELSRGLCEQIRKSERTSDYREIPAEQLRLAAAEVYRNLGEWLLEKTERDIEARFRAVAACRLAEGVRLHQFVWALTLSREHLWQFLRQQSFADNIVTLFGEMELQRLLNQFFDRAIYYAVWGYEEARVTKAETELQKMRNLALSIGLMSEARQSGSELENQDANRQI